MSTRALASYGSWIFTTALALSTACGGSVKVDDGSGGSGNAGGSGATGNTGATGNAGGTGNTGNISTGGTGNVGATGGSGGSSTTCDAFCDAAVECFEFPDCQGVCADLAADECGGEWLQLASCLAIELAPPVCNEGVCGKEQQVYSDCTNGGECIDQGCSGGPDGSCTCDATCFGQSYFTSCGVGPSGQVSCSCFVEGELWGTCNPFEPGFACGIEDGCCASVFFFDG